MLMHKSKRVLWLATYALAAAAVATTALRFSSTPTVHAQPAIVSGQDEVISDMTSAAAAWYASLTPPQQATAHFDFADPNRFDWHFIPRVRKGLAYKDMQSAQRALAQALLASGLSTRGYMQAETIMSLDQILKDVEPGPPKSPYRDPENYSFTLFGVPGDASAWGWRVEGHHLSVNFTIVDGKTVVGGPVFLGSNPAEVRAGPRKGLRVLAAEDDLGFDLIHSLDEAHRTKAVIAAKAPKDVITGNSRKANPGPPVGLAYADMSPEQQAKLTHLVEFYAHRLRSALAQDDLAKIDKAGWDKVHFAWAGGLQVGQGHYYRIHGPTFLIEFDNTQNSANHVHSVWRDAANDFGEDLLKEHYEKDHAGPTTNSVAK